MLRAVFAALALIACSALTHAQEASNDKILKAQKVFDLAMSDEILSDMGARTGRLMADQIGQVLAAKGSALTEEDRNELIVRFTTSFLREMKALEPDMARVYAAELSDEELDMMINLYSDPAMAALMAKLPVIMEKMTPHIMASSQTMALEIVQAMKAAGRLKDL